MVKHEVVEAPTNTEETYIVPDTEITHIKEGDTEQGHTTTLLYGPAVEWIGGPEGHQICEPPSKRIKTEGGNNTFLHQQSDEGAQTFIVPEILIKVEPDAPLSAIDACNEDESSHELALKTK